MDRRLGRDELIKLADNVLRPKGLGLTSQQITDQLFTFCINCPDPSAAMDIMIETRSPVTAETLTDMALACPERDLPDIPESELPSFNPLRRMIRPKP